jgi:hypothetical protein
VLCSSKIFKSRFMTAREKDPFWNVTSEHFYLKG